jgi:hypothetical protein
MVLNLVYLLLILVFVGCNKSAIKNESTIVNSNRSPDYNKINKLYDNIGLYRYLSFMRCLEVADNKSPEVQSLLKREFSVLEFPGIDIMHKIDSLAYLTKDKINEDSIYIASSWKKNPDYANLNGKRIIAHCLQLYADPILDTIFDAKNK